MATSTREFSIVEYYAEHERYRCGYCRSVDTNYSHGMWAHTMTVQDYQDLLDRGWRRSGRYCYKPTMNITCCPMYAIRCPAMDLKLSKSQKKIIKRIIRFVSYGDSKAGEDIDQHIVDSSCEQPVDISLVSKKRAGTEESSDKPVVSSVDPTIAGRIGTLADTLTGGSSGESEFSAVKEEEKTAGTTSSAGDSKKIYKPGEGTDLNRSPCKKAKLIRLERKKEKLMKKGLSAEDIDKAIAERRKPRNEEKSLEDLFTEPFPLEPKNNFEIRLVRSSPPSGEFELTSRQAYEVYQKYQMAIHGDPPDKCSMRQYTRFLVSSPLQHRLVLLGTEDLLNNLEETFALYRKYQLAIHKERPEECTQGTFCDFLATTPLKAWAPDDGPPCGYGSFHQQYWLNGRLIAVGVIDILPNCVSSVYFFYDPDFSHLSLGTYGSLRELYLTRTLQMSAPDLKYYYMGYYIHSCPKMRYKAAYNPSFLLCPETYTWHPVEKCKRKLDISPYARFEDDPTVKDEDGNIVISDVLILHRNRAMPFSVYAATVKEEIADIHETRQYADLVGMKCARRMLLLKQ